MIASNVFIGNRGCVDLLNSNYVASFLIKLHAKVRSLGWDILAPFLCRQRILSGQMFDDFTVVNDRQKSAEGSIISSNPTDSYHPFCILAYVIDSHFMGFEKSHSSEYSLPEFSSRLSHRDCTLWTN